MQLPLTQAEPLSERRGKRFFYVVGALVAIVMVQAYLEFATTDSRWKISQLFREVSSNVPTQQHDLETALKCNITRLTEEFPFFDIQRYNPGESSMMLRDYSLFHSYVLSGRFPPRYLIVDTHAGVGLGNSFIESASTVFEFDTQDQLKGLVKYGSFIDNIDNFTNNADIITLSKQFRVIDLPCYDLYRNPNYQHLIPQVIGDWKVVLTSYLFKIPTDSVVKAIQEIKDSMKPYKRLITMQVRVHFWAATAGAAQRTFDCAKYFDDNNTAFYLSVDDDANVALAEKMFGDRLFISGREPVHIAEYVGELPIKEIEGVMIDWWMIGEGDIKMVTWGSSFGITAAGKICQSNNLIFVQDRTASRRFVVNGNTQCSNPQGGGYLEELYISLADSYARDGVMYHEYGIGTRK